MLYYIFIYMYKMYFIYDKKRENVKSNRQLNFASINTVDHIVNYYLNNLWSW